MAVPSVLAASVVLVLVFVDCVGELPVAVLLFLLFLFLFLFPYLFVSL